MVREDFKSIEHETDIWHFAKCIKKKLKKLGKKHPAIKEWEKDIVNHFWFCCQKCHGNSDLLLELWHSHLLHISNQHTWKRQHLLKKKYGCFIGTRKKYPRPFQYVTACFHDTLTKKASRMKNWLKVDSPEFEELVKLFTNKRLCNEMRMCKSFQHTGGIENLHSVKNKYLPKRKHHSMECHIVSMMLVCLERNEHLDARKDNKTKIRKSVEYSKAAGDYVLKTKYLKDALPGKLDIMNGVTLSLKAGKAKAGDLKELLKPYITRPIPKNVNSKSREKPTLEYISSQYSKFKSDSIVVPVPITPAVPAAVSR